KNLGFGLFLGFRHGGAAVWPGGHRAGIGTLAERMNRGEREEKE
ncbi:hypothetical protein A2U01_0064082, partial [Trifolium medium]|nr:hypothetical protein [Trifolium medium]